MCDMTIEQKINNEYSTIFETQQKYWLPFKQMADYYFYEAAHLKKRNIRNVNSSLKLWVRNVQKRLFL